MRCVLAFDLTQRRACVALLKGTQQFVRAFVGQTTHGDDMLYAELDALLRESGVAKSELCAVAVAVGPGSFTGLRVSIATAKGIAAALGLRVIAIPSAFVEAEALRRVRGCTRSVVALASKRDTAWFAACVYRDGRWEFARVGIAGGVEALTECVASLGGGDSNAPIALVHDANLDSTLTHAAQKLGLCSESLCADGSALLAVAAACSDAGAWMDPLQLAPLYPREPEAVTIWNARDSAR
ncbi:MAG: tRNA (adenosine(37)-N6)-threonylcarbamoyltransferase complex dimerization subunit type 1 TsaB [Phycisphaerales bacterium]|nr:tRNA (adenosine(37)-N6)-threonylcarbamoyltransferase complex dimerization subunit type 1 TsaB [Phycisphaerales bacterium]